MRMSFALSTLALGVTGGQTDCMPIQVEPRLMTADAPPVLSVALAEPPERLMPRLLLVLQDMGCQVTSVEPRLGHLAFRQSWVDARHFAQPQHVIEGTLILQPEEAGGSRLRLSAKGWIEVGTASSTHAQKSQEKPLSTAEGQRFLDTLRTRLTR